MIELIAFYILAFMLGASIGSFLLVIVRRSMRGDSWIKGRSVCESCSKELQWWELIPTISFIILKGKCSKCKTKIDNSHFICETYLGLIYLIGLHLYLIGMLEVKGVILFLLIHSLLWITAVSDLLYQTIMTFPVHLLSLTVAISTLNIRFIILIICLIVASEFLIKDNMKWLGAGDIDIFIAILALTQSVLLTFDSIVNASFLGIILYIIGIRKAEKEKTIPFVPLLYFGYIFSSLGIGLMQWRF